MSLPTEIDFALISIKGEDGTLAVACGITDVSINQTANTADRFVRDCEAPGRPGSRKTKASGIQLDITGSGRSNAKMIPVFNAALGAVKDYEVALYQEDGSDTGDLLGTYAGAFRMTANNLSTAIEGESSGEIALANHGPWIYTAAA